MELDKRRLASIAKPVARFKINPKITLEAAQAALAKIAELNGCPACGFNGIDILFENEIRLPDFSGLPGIEHATIDRVLG